jgi:hypothetical protein
MKENRPLGRGRFFQRLKLLLGALDGQETVARVLVDCSVAGKVRAGVLSFILTEVINGLTLSTAQGYLLRV